MARHLFAALLEPHPPDPDFGPHVDPNTLVWPTRFLIINEADEGGAFLIEFDRRGRFMGDTWFEHIEDAKSQATFEHGDRVGTWEDIPPGISDFAAFGLARLGLG